MAVQMAATGLRASTAQPLGAGSIEGQTVKKASGTVGWLTGMVIHHRYPMTARIGISTKIVKTVFHMRDQVAGPICSNALATTHSICFTERHQEASLRSYFNREHLNPRVPKVTRLRGFHRIL